MLIDIHAPDRTGQVCRAARRVAWSEWGSPQGKPVLFCTGAGMSSSLGFGASALDSLELRLICVDRAGLGSSEPDPAKSFASYAGDVAEVLQSQRIHAPPPVVAFSQGAPFAVALAAAGVVESVTLVAGQDELAHPTMRRAVPDEVRQLIAAVEDDPVAAEASFAMYADAEGFWSMIRRMSAPLDRAFYEQPRFADAYKRCLNEGFAQGAAGYARDLVLALGRWPTQPEQISQPVGLWYGSLDASPVHSPDFGVTLSARFPRARLYSFADQGGALLWTRSREILRSTFAAREPRG